MNESTITFIHHRLDTLRNIWLDRVIIIIMCKYCSINREETVFLLIFYLLDSLLFMLLLEAPSVTQFVLHWTSLVDWVLSPLISFHSEQLTMLVRSDTAAWFSSFFFFATDVGGSRWVEYPSNPLLNRENWIREVVRLNVHLKGTEWVIFASQSAEK